MANAQCKVTDGVNWDSIEPLGRCRTYGGYGAFATTDTSVVVYIPADVSYIIMATLTPVFATAAQAANGEVTITGVTVNGDGSLTPTTAGQLTILRIAGTDSALGFCFDMKWR